MSSLLARRAFALFVVFAMLLGSVASTSVMAQGTGTNSSSDGVSDGPAAASAEPQGLQQKDPNGIVDVLIEMEGAPLADAIEQREAALGPATATDAAFQTSYNNQLLRAQAPVVATAAQYGTVTGQLTRVSNIVTMTGVQRRNIESLRNLPGVKNVEEATYYELSLNNSVPYVGAEAVRTNAALNNRGIQLDGRGTKVAIIDSGVDYTHRDFGGPGTIAAYDFATSGGRDTVINETYTWDGGTRPLFPTEKVAGGYDFVGQYVSTGPLTRTLDPDPIDPPILGGHGTHVAGIAAGFGVPNASVGGSIPANSTFNGTTVYHGVAPAAQIYAYRVCGDNCPNTALLEALERTVDLDGDGIINEPGDRVDALNMSIGGRFGSSTAETAALDRVVDLGVAAAVSAGNNANIPFITGGFASGAKALGVAASTVGTQTTSAISVTLSVSGTFLAGFNEASGTPRLYRVGPITGPAKYGTTAAQRIGCDVAGVNPFPAGFFTGQIALIDRGTCTFQEKVDNAVESGAIAVVLMNNAPGSLTPAVTSTIPVVMISQADGNTIKSAIAQGQTVTIRLSAEFTITTSNPALNDVLADFTSRGPARLGSLKPDLAAPGVNIRSAQAGSGDKALNLSGTSMAAPHVAGALALVTQLRPTWSVLDREALLVNSSKPELYVNSNTSQANLAPISLAGAGRLDLVAAAALETTVRGNDLASINFGIYALTGPLTVSRVFTITNHSAAAKSYNIAASTQFTQPAAITFNVSPTTRTVAAGSTATATLTITIDPSKLPQYNLAGSGGASGANLSAAEIAGRIVVLDQATQQPSRMTWYVLPRRASDVRASTTFLSTIYGPGAVTFNNTSPFSGTAELFHLVGVDPKEQTDPVLTPSDIQYVGVRPIAVSTSPTITTRYLDFGIKTYEARTIPQETEFDVYVDTNRDGSEDYVIFNTGFGFAGDVNRVYVLNLRTNAITLSGFLDSNIYTSNVIMRVPITALGLTATQPFDFYVTTFTNFEAEEAEPNEDTDYFVDVAPDRNEYTFDPSNRRYVPSQYTVVVPGNSSRTISVAINPNGNANEQGLLVLYRENVPPLRDADILAFTCRVPFTDVPTENEFYGYIEYLACRGVVSGYADGTFRPNNPTTRGQAAKIATLAFGFPIDTTGGPHFTDVPVGSTFYPYIETLANRGIIGGYADRTFRPNAHITRGQIAKVMVNSAIQADPANWQLLNPTTNTFQDVPVGSTYFRYIETAAAHRVVGGYPCTVVPNGCATSSKPYFLPGNNATRAQIAKIAYLAVTFPAADATK